MDPEGGEVLPETPGPLGTRLKHTHTGGPVKNPSAVRQEEVIREFPPLGAKYRIRLLSDPRSKGKVLDIREYLVTRDSSFEGFTRRGIRLNDRAQVELLRDVCSELLRDLLL